MLLQNTVAHGNPEATQDVPRQPGEQRRYKKRAAAETPDLAGKLSCAAQIAGGPHVFSFASSLTLLKTPFGSIDRRYIHAHTHTALHAIVTAAPETLL